MASQNKRPASSQDDGQSPSSSQSQRNSSKLFKTPQTVEYNSADRKKLVSDVVFYFLTQEQKRVPHKRGDIFKAVGLSGQPKDLQDDVLNHAIKQMNEAFGITVKNLPGDKHLFILINKLQLDSDPEKSHLKSSEHESATRGLLTSLLSLIFMSGNVVREDQLILFLNKMGLQGENADERVKAAREAIVPGGNIKQFIEKDLAAKQHYLSVTKIDGSDPDNPILEYRWGERATLEVKKSKILLQVCKLYKCKPSAFADQCEQVKQEEGADALDDETEPMEVAQQQQEDED